MICWESEEGSGEMWEEEYSIVCSEVYGTAMQATEVVTSPQMNE